MRSELVRLDELENQGKSDVEFLDSDPTSIQIMEFLWMIQRTSSDVVKNTAPVQAHIVQPATSQPAGLAVE